MLNIRALKEKKRIIYLIIGLVVFVLIVFGYFIFLTKKGAEPEPSVKKEKAITIEEIIRRLTAPTTTEANQVSKEVIESLTASGKKQPSKVPKEIIQGLTAPEE